MLALLYVGPGLGAGVVATVIGVIGSMFLAAFGIIWYPFKRMLRRRRASRESAKADSVPAPVPGDR